MVIIVMGVAGAGKTTVGRRLAQEVGWTFYDADDFHPPSNVEKMEAGVPLTEEDRRPWLDRLRELIVQCGARQQDAVLACSALRQQHRERLRPKSVAAKFVYLKLSPELARQRISDRSGHYMPAELIASQFETLEEPRNALQVSADKAPEDIVGQIMRQLGLQRKPGISGADSAESADGGDHEQ